MTNNPSKEKIVEVVKKSFSEALLIPVEKVVPLARVISDLHAESIDVADIRFRIEDGLGIRIDQREMTQALGENLTAEEFDNRFTVQFVIDYAKKQSPIAK